MYYPYLRAKQFELKALKEFSAENKGQHSITPILEPVKQQQNALFAATDEMLENELKFALILNPHDGDFKHHSIVFDRWYMNENLMANKNNWIPAFIYSKDNNDEISFMIDRYELSHVMVLFISGLDLEDSSAWEIINRPSVDYVLTSVQSIFPRRLKRRLKDINKQIIRLDDCFKPRVRNADYALNDDELFTEEPFFYSVDEGLDGYSDYTTLPSEYIEGGMMPYALAIHFSYKKNEEQIYVHHFVSDNNKTNSDIRGKFKEAASKIEPFYDGKYKTSAVREAIAKAKDPDGYPGLGYLKKLSVKNHLELILSI